MLFEQIARNKRRTIYVMLGFGLLMLAIGAAVGYVFFDSWAGGMILALIIALVYSLIMISQSTNVVMSMNHAREITNVDQDPELWHIVEDMALVARVPMPRVFIIDDPSPNALPPVIALKNAAVAVTTGIQQRLDREEMEGVIGHEMSHVRNYDIRLSTIALALASAIAMLANFGMHWLWWGGGNRRRNNDSEGGNGTLEIVMMVLSLVLIILGPIAASIAQMALSRNREYLADAGSVELTRNPVGLIHALQKIDDSQPMTQADTTSAALYIGDPFKKKHGWSHLFDTHPATADRIARLEKM